MQAELNKSWSYILLSFQKGDTAQEINVSVGSPKVVDANGLIQCVRNLSEIVNLLDRKSVLDVEGKSVLVGSGTVGASVNMAQQNGMIKMPNLGLCGCGAMPTG